MPKRRSTIRNLKVDGESRCGFVKLSVCGHAHHVPFSQTADYLKPNPKASGCKAWRRYEGYMSATTIGEALEHGSCIGDMVYDLKRGFLSLPGFRRNGKKAQRVNGKPSMQVRSSGKSATLPFPAHAGLRLRQALGRGLLNEPRKKEPFAYVLSLGSRCVVARLLRDLHLRRFAGPFDWVYSCPQMVRDCLKNDFCKFLDPNLIVAKGHAWTHREYSLLLHRDVVFPHHEPRIKDRAFFKRSVARFRLVMASPLRKLFVIVHPVASAKALHEIREEGLAELGRLFADLRSRGAVNFDLFAVHLVYGKCSEVASGSQRVPVMRCIEDTCSGKERMVLWELHCVGQCTGLNMKAEADEKVLQKLLIGNSKQKRSFDLLPDPVVANAIDGDDVGGRRQNRSRLGDPTEGDVHGARKRKRRQLSDPTYKAKRVRLRKRPSSVA